MSDDDRAPRGTGEGFRHFAAHVSDAVGTSLAFVLAVALVAVWAVFGPFVGYSDSWELFINTVTTIVTFLMVFLIQSAQNRDARAVQLKLDELLRAVKGARTGLVQLEDLSDAQIARLRKEFHALHEQTPSPAPTAPSVDRRHRNL